MLDTKSYLIEILEFYIYKLKKNSCTMQEMNGAIHALEQNMEINGTIQDFANFYGEPESNIRTIIARKLIAKPKRQLLYPFHKFAKIIPERWRKK